MKYQAKKRFGQNFLVDPYVINKIIEAGQFHRDDVVFEIGPGLGALTKPLLDKLDHLNVIEIDSDIVSNLKDTYSDSTQRLKIYHQDALKVDFNLLFLDTNTNRNKIIGNLPYNISTALLMKLMPYAVYTNLMVFMLQKEVIDRICAKPNNKTYGRLTVMIEYFCDVERIISVPPSAFQPQPKVQSEVIRLKPKNNRLTLIDFKLFEKIVFHAFQQRRKTISNSLKLFLNSDDFTQLDINPKLRAENLNLENFVSISNYVAKK